MKAKTYTISGIVLKRVSTGETDRIVTLLTQDQGKITCIAKGVRKLNSSRSAVLEPGNFIKAFLVSTKSLPIMTQAIIIEDCNGMANSLASIRALSQLLEILEKLFVEEQLDDQTYRLVLLLRKQVITNNASPQIMRRLFGQLITLLGYQHPDDSKYDTISDYISALSDKPVRSFEYLQVKGS